jgi:threonylcarbamoyladenosine tRNA methylthiotransferase MtaB
MKTFKILTLGCKVNQYDSEVIRNRLTERGFQEIDNGEGADLYVINTCTVTAGADKDSLRLIRKIRRRRGLESRILLTGCLVQKDAYRLLKETSADYVISKGFFPQEGISSFKGHTRAFLKVQDGCDNRCSYCKVSLVRGRSRSRSLERIKREVNELLGRGFKEIVLSGICLGAYGLDISTDLICLIEELEKMDSLFRLRLSSIEPMYITDDLIDKIRDSAKLCKHLHIPFQSGDEEILRKMNRPYKISQYKKLIDKLFRTVPDISVTSDIVVGFPGEEDENFQNTCKFIQYLRPLKIHIFPYSPREGTEAFNLPGRLPEEVLRERKKQLEEIVKRSSFEYRRRFLQKQVEVLVEAIRDKKTGLLKGYTSNYMKLLLKGDDCLMNKILPARITQVCRDRTMAELS